MLLCSDAERLSAVMLPAPKPLLAVFPFVCRGHNWDNSFWGRCLQMPAQPLWARRGPGMPFVPFLSSVPCVVSVIEGVMNGWCCRDMAEGWFVFKRCCETWSSALDSEWVFRQLKRYTESEVCLRMLTWWWFSFHSDVATFILIVGF